MLIAALTAQVTNARNIPSAGPITANGVENPTAPRGLKVAPVSISAIATTLNSSMPFAKPIISAAGPTPAPRPVLSDLSAAVELFAAEIVSERRVAHKKTPAVFSLYNLRHLDRNLARFAFGFLG